MILLSELQTLLEHTQDALQPEVETLNQAKQQFEETKKQMFEPFLKKLDEYYDQELVGKNNVAAKVGALIIGKRHTYKVIERGCQIILSRILPNPRVIVRKTKDNGITTWGIDETFGKRDLANMEVVAVKEKEVQP